MNVANDAERHREYPRNIKLNGLTTKLRSFPHIFASIRCAPTKRVGIVTTANAAERTHVYSSG
jgi:hypothetical protein